MQLATLALGASAMFIAHTTAAALPVPSSGPNATFDFSIYQSLDCSDTSGPPANVTGDLNNFDSCAPELEFYFGSVFVRADAQGLCRIAFFDTANCSSQVAIEPGEITLGKCFEFDAEKRPLTYGVLCE